MTRSPIQTSIETTVDFALAARLAERERFLSMLIESTRPLESSVQTFLQQMGRADAAPAHA